MKPFLSMLFALGLFSTADAGAEKPNILLICVDDLKPALGCYGDSLARTPHLDALAQRSLRFERAYCNQAVCSPSRNALLLGLRPQSLGIYDLGTNFRRAVPEAVTMPQYFRQHGWRTEALGKIFHVGHGNNEDTASWSVPHWRPQVPTYAADRSVASTAPQPRAKTKKKNKKGKQADPPRGPAYEAGDVPDAFYVDGALADEAIRRLQAAAERPDQPFFLALGFIRPHLPFVAPRKYWDAFQRDSFPLAMVRSAPDGAPSYAPQPGGELRQYQEIPKSGMLDEDLQRTLIHGYYSATSYMDAQLGRVLEALDREGLADKTIVVVWGDHGWHLGDHSIWCKHTNYEQAARIPLLVAVPHRKTGASSGALVESVDIFPTLCELSGLNVPSPLDGRSFAQVLQDADAPTKDHIIHVYPRSAPEVGPVLGRAIRTERYRLVEWKKVGAEPASAELELYDYETDPLERRNLAGEKPEIVAELRALLAQHPEAKPQLSAAPIP